jgi:hypothetical protein
VLFTARSAWPHAMWRSNATHGRVCSDRRFTCTPVSIRLPTPRSPRTAFKNSPTAKDCQVNSKCASLRPTNPTQVCDHCGPCHRLKTPNKRFPPAPRLVLLRVAIFIFTACRELGYVVVLCAIDPARTRSREGQRRVTRVVHCPARQRPCFASTALVGDPHTSCATRTCSMPNSRWCGVTNSML